MRDDYSTYGNIALIRMPAFPNSPAADSVNPITANLLVEYAALCGRPCSPEVLDTFTIEPPGLVSFASWARMQCMTPLTLTPMVNSQSFCTCYMRISLCYMLKKHGNAPTKVSTVVSPSPPATPATFAAPSSFPNSVYVSSIQRFTSSTTLTSTFRVVILVSCASPKVV